MADQLVNHYKKRITGLTLIPSGGGKFEVSVGGELIYSKLATGEFPGFEEVTQGLAAKGG